LTNIDEGMPRRKTLLKDADVFFSNRLAGYLDKYGLSAPEL